MLWGRCCASRRSSQIFDLVGTQAQGSFCGDSNLVNRGFLVIRGVFVWDFMLFYDYFNFLREEGEVLQVYYLVDTIQLLNDRCVIVMGLSMGRNMSQFYQDMSRFYQDRVLHFQ
eukprot:TRINITY_DN5525_c0_g1_i10.p5 TRINITY_DN5525_c0_g1~~TRINITY_DN5525_c0_g1_i10.p5  ORF type:complete len:114 (-),score=7.01 TRINITY_DN5525_c0_g1_i10:116-457(-)